MVVVVVVDVVDRESRLLVELHRPRSCWQPRLFGWTVESMVSEKTGNPFPILHLQSHARRRRRRLALVALPELILRPLTAPSPSSGRRRLHRHGRVLVLLPKRAFHNRHRSGTFLSINPILLFVASAAGCWPLPFCAPSSLSLSWREPNSETRLSWCSLCGSLDIDREISNRCESGGEQKEGKEPKNV